MRSEELINEAKAYNAEGCAYLHGEVYKLHAGGVIVSGEEAAIVVILYSMLEAAATQNLPSGASEKEIKQKMSSYIKHFKQFMRISDSLVREWGITNDEQKI